MALADGVNPLRGSLGHFLADHYPKAAWIFSGGMYRLTGNIEYGKSITVLLALACFGVAGTVFLSVRRLRAGYAYLLAALVTLNPVTVVQLDTHYVDGLFSSLAVLLVLAAVALGPARLELGVARRQIFAVVVGSAVLLANLKFTGLVFVVALLALQAVWTLVDRRVFSAEGSSRSRSPLSRSPSAC